MTTHPSTHTHRFVYVLCGVVAFLLHALLHEVNTQLQVEVLLLQSHDLLRIGEEKKYRLM